MSGFDGCALIYFAFGFFLKETVDHTKTADGVEGGAVSEESAASDGPIASTKTVISDIEKLRKIAEIIATVGEAVIPAVVNEQNNAKSSQASANEPTKSFPKNLHLINHHEAVSAADKW